MNLAVIATVFPVIFLGELPDKTMFASLLLAAKGKPLAVWSGASAAFAVHVVIAVAIGGAISLVPHRYVGGLAAGLFLAGAVMALRDTEEKEEDGAEEAMSKVSSRRHAAAAFGVIFVAEWGDLTQVLTATMAARYHSPLSVGVGALAALVIVAALAVVAGKQLSRVPVKIVRRITAAVLLVLAVVAGAAAIAGS
ncbi:MAG: TMEM165/GDT1 family protein [Actinomycetota bacterium]|nr:TMEM165/GDT1 family protein [Actinomycetota bacterium]